MLTKQAIDFHGHVMRLLLIEDDPTQGRAVQLGLEQEGYIVDWLIDALQVESSLKNHEYAAIILDLGLPNLDGLTLLRRVRLAGYHRPLIITTARGDVTDKVSGLDAGADDFIVKPFDLNELAARIRAAIRRCSNKPNHLIQIGNITIDITRRTVKKNQEVINLTAKEYTLLLNLVENDGMVRTRGQLEECMYGWGEEVDSNSVEVHIHHLRKKLGKSFIRTVHGVGYTIDSHAMNQAAQSSEQI